MKQSSLVFLLVFFISASVAGQGYTLNITKNWQFSKTGEEKWYPAAVPGTVHTDLLSNKLISDPFYGDNEKKLQWIENEDWEYKTVFDLLKGPSAFPHIELQFEGLDTYAKVYLNDSLILTADNMFRTWNVDVKKYCQVGKNTLLIKFESAVKRGKEEAKKLSYTLPGDEKIFTRKAQYQYGWDWGPRFVTCGIWKNIKLIAWKDAVIKNVQYVQHSLNDSQADLEFKCEVKSDVQGTYGLWVEEQTMQRGNHAKQEAYELVSLKKGMNTVNVHYTVLKPKLWWCNGLGDHPLYSFEVMLREDEQQQHTKAPKILDAKQLTVGLRTVELIQEKDSVGSSFYFKLNGVPVFMKGANYIPSDNFMPRVTKDKYVRDVQNAVDANMNMLRVWGGGVYADDEFYNQCDQKGILVWQDLMFACAMYPGDDHFMENAAQEIVDQSTRLRNHPSLVLWCGNNEIDEGWKNWEWQKQFKYSEKDSTKIERDYQLLFENLIPGILKVQDPGRPYHPSSPSIGWGHKESLEQGDSHYWGVWWGDEPFEMYEKKVGRFVSEYGFQGMPDINTLAKVGGYIYSTNKNPMISENFGFPFEDTTILNVHQKSTLGYQKIRTYMERDYIVPKKFEDYIYVSQLLQAEGMKTAIEAHRRAKPYCMGTLYWQLNDCWPVASWSSVDYYNVWKASQYVAQKSYSNVLLSVKQVNGTCYIYIVNDRRWAETMNLYTQLRNFNGHSVLNKMITIDIPANSCKIYDSINVKEFSKADRNNVFLETALLSPIPDITLGDGNTVFYFAKPKELELKKPKIVIEYTENKGCQAIVLTSDVLAKNVYISIEGESVNLSDNYLDLLPGESNTIYLPPGIKIKDLYKKIKIKSLVDTY